MNDDIVRMHLAQALTRTIDIDTRTHVRAALDGLDGEDVRSSEMIGNPTLSRIERAEAELESWLAHHATENTPELVLTGILREYAELIDELGYVPRSWTNSRDPGSRYSSSLERPTVEKAPNEGQWRDSE